MSASRTQDASRRRRKVLIVKTGHTELLTCETSGGPSLGDVFRNTCLLWEYINDDVTWLTSASASSLLPGEPFIQEKLDWSSQTLDYLATQSFDLILNLERCQDISGWVESFFENSRSRSLLSVTNSRDGLAMFGNCATKITVNTRFKSRLPWRLTQVLSGEAGMLRPATWGGRRQSVGHAVESNLSYQEHLFKAIGKKWQGQSYTIPAGVDPSIRPTLSVGFNFAVGAKWPVKAWPKDSWSHLAGLCESGGISYSFQEGFDDLHRYISWLQNHDVIVTSDSLGLHLALALGRKVIGLFGPTRAQDIYFYGRGEGLVVDSACPRIPCFQNECDFKTHCMTTITPQQVFSRVKHYLDTAEVSDNQPWVGWHLTNPYNSALLLETEACADAQFHSGPFRRQLEAE